MSQNKIEPTKREVIENQLLTSLCDKSKAAVLFTESDLDLMISALMLARTNRMANMMRMDEFQKDLTELKNAAFPKTLSKPSSKEGLE
jgi:hypothetical protein